MLCGLISFVHPSQPLEEENNFEIWGGAGDKVVWRLVQNTLSQMLEEHFSEVAKHLGANIISTSNISDVQVVKVTR